MYELDKYTVSLLHFDDGIKDETGKVWTAVGSPAISSEQSRIGEKSLYLDGKSYLYAKDVIDITSGDFTIDWWEYRNNNSTHCCTLEINYLNSSNYGGILFDVIDGKYSLYLTTSSGTFTVANSELATVKTGEWTHIAISRKDSDLYAFINGKLCKVIHGANNLKILSNLITLGFHQWNSGTKYYMDGYIDEFRISNIARWTEGFPIEPVNKNALLRVTMLDSSERDYQLSTTEIKGFINWFNNHTATSTTSYMLDKKVGTQNSKEYLSFDKIISFEVLELK